jgi:hypothetical protein
MKRARPFAAAHVLAWCALIWPLAASAASAASARDAEETDFRNWILARCMAVMAGSGPVAQDAAATASAYLERGHLPAEAYEAGDALVTTALARTLTGSVPVRFDTMKCIELTSNPRLRDLVRRHRRR